MKVLFLSDLDGTWLSRNPESRKKLDEGVVALKDEFHERGIDLEFGYVTARPGKRVVDESLPAPDWTITYNGGFIHEGQAGTLQPDGTYRDLAPLPAWEQRNQESGFSASRTVKLVKKLVQRPEYRNLMLQTVGQVVHTPASDACPWLAVLCFDEKSIRLTADEAADRNGNGRPDVFEKETFQTPAQIRSLVSELQHELDARGVHYQMSPVYPFLGKPITMFDVSSPVANKGKAIEFLMNQEGITADHVIIAGDGGNDIAMMRAQDGHDDGRRAIVVGGEASLYEAASHLEHAILQPAEMDCSEAVLDGLRKQLEAIAKEKAA